jgi:hypothetical protein
VAQFPEPLHRTIVVVDVARFTDPRRTVLHLEAIHQGLYQVLEEAFAESAIEWQSCTHEDRGDGVLILVPPDVPKSRLAGPLSERLLAGVRRYNLVHSAEATMQLRVALHSGEVRADRNGLVSQEINFAFRILEADTAKTELARSGSVLALITSDGFYREVVAPDAGADPAGFRQIPVQVKQTTGVAWLRLLGDPDRVLNVLPEPESARVRDWLADVAVPRLPTLLRRAAGPSVPPPPAGSDAWQVFEYLSDFNARQDGFPPSLAFADLLARQLGGPLGEKLTAWCDDQARKLRLETALANWRTEHSTVADDPRLHLVIAVEHDALDDERCLVSHWRQDDPDQWPPARGTTYHVPAGGLERQVDELVVAAERSWAGHDGTVAIEFVLPRALLGRPVHLWCKERATGDPRPLCLEYPVVVRSLERMRSTHWRRVWRRRWAMLVADPSAARVHFAPPQSKATRYAVDVLLDEDPAVAAIVLDTAPTPEPVPGDHLTAALRAGLPAVLWHPASGSSDELREVVTHLVEEDGLGDLPTRTKAVRHAAFLSSSTRFDPILGRDLVVLWDNPDRVVAFDQQPETAAAGQGGASIEAERAS